jgi:hypothetical protein
LRYDQAHYDALVPKDASVVELPEHICLDWVLRDVVDEIDAALIRFGLVPPRSEPKKEGTRSAHAKNAERH